MDGRVQAWSPLCRVRHPARTRPRATDEFPPVWWSIEDRTQHPTGRCPKEEWMPKITPCLWFDTEGERAAQHYTSVFPDSRISEVARYGPAGPRPEGTVMTRGLLTRRPRVSRVERRSRVCIHRGNLVSGPLRNPGRGRPLLEQALRER